MRQLLKSTGVREHRLPTAEQDDILCAPERVPANIAQFSPMITSFFSSAMSTMSSMAAMRLQAPNYVMLAASTGIWVTAQVRSATSWKF